MRRRHPSELEEGDGSPGGSPRNSTRRLRGRKHAPFCLMFMVVLFSSLIIVAATILCAFLVMGWPMPFFPGQDRRRRPVLLSNGAEPDAYVAGMIRMASEIRPSIIETLVSLSCSHNVGVHIVAADGVREAQMKVEEQRAKFFYEARITQAGFSLPEVGAEVGACAPFKIIKQDDSKIFRVKEGGSVPTNRVERIAALRDYQRSLLRPLFRDSSSQDSRTIRDGVVLVIDLDLGAIPPATSLSSQIAAMLYHRHSHDVVCAAGVTMASKHDPWYYDTYATVLLPDTYTHPLKRRVVGKYYAEEDPKLVRSDDQHGNFTQGDLMKWLYKRAKEEELNETNAWGGMVRVRSCFGGLALYRTAAWFRTQCQYGNDTLANELVRYASKADGRPCEHVVFHHCLRERGIVDSGGVNNRDVDVAIDPRMYTFWKKD
mmetsp:Transcript_11499/g.33887  ORF Transcript_11499/g.33887 Transcript_11499/m.33887 type:complete len:430 (-) Transcript_11499:61-1350(-)